MSDERFDLAHVSARTVDKEINRAIIAGQDLFDLAELLVICEVRHADVHTDAVTTLEFFGQAF